MSNKYPSFVPPASGYVLYPFASETKHLGVYDHMDWDKKLNPIQPVSYYHPFYLHHINDGLLSLRDPVKASTMELGIGRHIAEVAQYVNSSNLGYSNQRIGVSYFKNIGSSGSVTWYNDSNTLKTLTINSGLAAKTITTDLVGIVSGYFSNAAKFSIEASNASMIITSRGVGYIDRLDSKTRQWGFAYGDIKTLGDISLLNSEFKIFNESSGVLDMYKSVVFKGPISTRDLTLGHDGIVSGIFDTYLSVGVADTQLITYSTTGHSHDASGWVYPTSDSALVGNIIFDGRYYYAVGESSILEFDSLGTKENWISRPSSVVPFDYNTRVYKDNTNLNIVNSQWVPHVSSFRYTDKYSGRLGDKVATIGELVIFGNIGSDTLQIADGRTFKLTGVIVSTDEFYFIDGNVYFVHTADKQLIIYRFNGKVWKEWNYYLQGQFINSCVANSEIYIAQKVGVKLAITRFYLIGNFRSVNSYTLYGDPKTVAIFDHDLICLTKDLPGELDRYHLGSPNNYSLHVYSLNNPSRYQLLFYNLIRSSIGIFCNSQYVFVQAGPLKRKILKNKSTALTLDAIGGLYDLNGDINVGGSLKSKALIMARCIDSLYVEDSPIYKHMFLLEPETVTYKDSFINRLVFNQIFSDAHTYNDQTCSVVYDGMYYIGHRGDVTSFLKTGDTLKNTPSKLDNKIVAKFLPLNNSLYALVQDFQTATVDFTLNVPSSPNASEYDKTNFIPYHPGPWSVPVTRLYYKTTGTNTWREDTKYIERYGNNIIDATAHDNNIYIIAHDRSGSGIISSRHSYDQPNPTGILLSFSGVLDLKESFVGPGMLDEPLVEFVPTTDGRFIKPLDGPWSGLYEYRTSPDLNGHHEFYLYNHPIGPYVIHDQVELLYNTVPPSSVFAYRYYGYPTLGYGIKNKGNKYNYRTISVTFLKQEYTRPKRFGTVYDTIIQLPFTDVNTPNIKIPICIDHPEIITDELENNKYSMKSLAQDSKISTRKNIHVITSVTRNKNIFILVQIDQSVRIYCIRDFNDYIFKTNKVSKPDDSYFIDWSSNEGTIFGEGLSYAGNKTYTNFIPVGECLGVPAFTSNSFFLDFIPCDISNSIFTEFNIRDVIDGNSGPVHIFGDGEDLFVDKPKSTNYRYNKRFATHSTMSIGSNLYVPITCRVNHPHGKLYTFVLGFFADGSVGLVDKNEVPIELIGKPMGRSQCVYKDGKYIISATKIADESREYITYREMKNDPVYGQVLLDSVPHDIFTSIYNPFAPKRWIIGEYDVTVNDNLNVRETF